MARIRTTKGAPGIQEVAKRAGVSLATVSRCFNYPDQVRESTRNKVQTAAAELGYIRNRMAGALHSRASGSVGLVVPTIDNAIFAELIEAITTRLQHHDRTLLIAAHGYDLAQEVSIVRSLLERRIDGVALVGFDHDEVAMRMLSMRSVPVLSVWNYQQNSAFHCIGADNRAAGREAFERLFALGHRDIACLFPAVSHNDRARDRYEGALQAAIEADCPVPERRQFDCSYDLGEAKSVALEMLSGDKPSAVLCGNDIIAQGVIYACIARGVRVPQELSVVGIGDFRGSADIEPGLSTVRLPAKRIGTEAADTIVELSEQPLTDARPQRKLLEHRWVERGSTASI
ncbi:MAG: LacI family DNA-binding transcriptional regulator [Granulosicoccaceae bacterium]